MTTVHVTGCDECPFADVVDSAGHAVEYPACQAPGTTGDGVLFDDGIPSTAPVWCPLREGSVLVMLGVETT